MAAPANPKFRHFTTRRGFAIFLGLLVLALYFMWAGYGAAPTSLRFLTGNQSESMGGMARGGHGGRTGGMTPEEFHEITVKFVEDLSLADGSVRQSRRRQRTAHAPVDGFHGGDGWRARKSRKESRRAW